MYLSNIPKALSKADVRWLVEEIPGVTGLRLPKRGGKNMGYSFITCDSEASANAVIAAVHGMELEGKALVAERARTETRSAGDAADKDQKKTEMDKGKKQKRGKQWKRDAQEEEEEEEEDAAVDPIAAARAEMEAEAILELERARRAAKKQMEAAEAVAAERRAKEAAAEARTTAMLAERRRRAEAAASAAARNATAKRRSGERLSRSAHRRGSAVGNRAPRARGRARGVTRERRVARRSFHIGFRRRRRAVRVVALIQSSFDRRKHAAVPSPDLFYFLRVASRRRQNAARARRLAARGKTFFRGALFFFCSTRRARSSHTSTRSLAGPHPPHSHHAP